MFGKFFERLFFGHSAYGIIGITLIIITFLICGTVLLISIKKIESQKECHKEKLEDANRIRVKFCKYCKQNKERKR